MLLFRGRGSHSHVTQAAKKRLEEEEKWDKEQQAALQSEVRTPRQVDCCDARHEQASHRVFRKHVCCELSRGTTRSRQTLRRRRRRRKRRRRMSRRPRKSLRRRRRRRNTRRRRRRRQRRREERERRRDREIQTDIIEFCALSNAHAGLHRGGCDIAQLNNLGTYHSCARSLAVQRGSICA